MFAPAGSGWIKHRVDGVIPIHTGTLRHLEERGGEARFSVDTATGPVELAADHVVAATGYKGDTRRLPFLRGLEGELRTIGAGVPVLNRAFETSIPGLYIAGFLSAATFGPSMRFIYGAAFAGRQISRHTAHLAAGKRRSGRISFSPAVRADASL
jgi:thioredoxin reductase